MVGIDAFVGYFSWNSLFGFAATMVVCCLFSGSAVVMFCGMVLVGFVNSVVYYSGYVWFVVLFVHDVFCALDMFVVCRLFWLVCVY